MKLVILMCLALVLVVGCKGIDSVKPVTEPVLESITNLTNQVHITNQVSIVSTNDSNGVVEKVNCSKHSNETLLIIGVLGFIVLSVLIVKCRKYFN